jgi:hypothetical protein
MNQPGLKLNDLVAQDTQNAPPAEKPIEPRGYLAVYIGLIGGKYNFALFDDGKELSLKVPENDTLKTELETSKSGDILWLEMAKDTDGQVYVGDFFESSIQNYKANLHLANLNSTQMHRRLMMALEIALTYGQVDGVHHLRWTIDQMVRAILHDSYSEVIKNFEGHDDEGYPEYEWDQGIAP